MKRLAVAALLVPATLFAARVRTFPPEPIHVGDYVRIEIGLPSKPLSSTATPQFATNIKDRVTHVDRDASTVIVEGWTPAAGDIVLGPFQYGAENGQEVTAPEVRIRVAPDLADGTKPAESLTALSSANRVAVVITSSLRKPVILDGEEAVVEWWAVGDLDAVFLDDFRDVMPVPGVVSYRVDSPRIRKLDAMGGRLVMKELKAEYHLLPSGPGTYTIPAATFRGEDRTRTMAATGQRARFYRIAPPLQLQVTPRPADAIGPVGTFRMQCTAPWTETWWPVMRAEISGTGRLDAAAVPRFLKPPDATILIHNDEPRFDDRQMSRAWAYEVHADNGHVPPLAFTYFDVDKHQNIDLRCDPPAVTSRHPTTPATKPSIAARPTEKWWLDLVEIAELLAVAAAGYVLYRTIRG